jgi:hypothetical protein
VLAAAFRAGRHRAGCDVEHIRPWREDWHLSLAELKHIVRKGLPHACGLKRLAIAVLWRTEIEAEFQRGYNWTRDQIAPLAMRRRQVRQASSLWNGA